MERYRQAQRYLHQKALSEIQEGKKEGHWMWFEFPQAYGLGQCEISQYYGLRGLEEAREYLQDDELRKNLEEMCKALLERNPKIPEEIFGWLDAKKLWSSMTIFAIADANVESIYYRILKRFYGGRLDNDTVEVLHKYYKGDIM